MFPKDPIMKKTKAHTTARKFSLLALAFSLCCGIVIADQRVFGLRAQANTGRSNLSRKTSPDLRGKKLGEPRVRVILQLNGKPSGKLNALLNRNGVHVRGSFNNFNAKSVELPVGIVSELASFEEVVYVSTDRQTRAAGHMTTTTGAAGVRQQYTAGGTPYTLDGSGVGIAVLDSGHRRPTTMSFQTAERLGQRASSTARTSRARAAPTTPTGTARTSPRLAAGNGRVSDGVYIGVAPNANLINLRVLNSKGIGTTSGTLAALDWVMTNHAAYNIRVVNMSLGMPAVDSYKNDPLCLAVRRLVDAGIVVVAAAGNNGKDAQGNKVYGHIHSPGNEPSAITVGATNTFGTDWRLTTTVTTYSSRGPTRTYWTDDGRRHALRQPHQARPRRPRQQAGLGAVAEQPAHAHRASRRMRCTTDADPATSMMYLSGTSMATPVVAGAAALLLQANPKLTPNMVKTILMYTAQPLAGFNTCEQGAGQLNIEGAVRLAKLVRTDLSNSTALGAPFLTSGAAPAPYTNIAGFYLQLVARHRHQQGLRLRHEPHHQVPAHLTTWAWSSATVS